MAGEVTRRQQKRIAAEAPPPFINRAGTRGLGRENTTVEPDISKVCSSSRSIENTRDSSSSNKAPIWTKARWKARMIWGYAKAPESPPPSIRLICRTSLLDRIIWTDSGLCRLPHFRLLWAVRWTVWTIGSLDHNERMTRNVKKYVLYPQTIPIFAVL